MKNRRETSRHAANISEIICGCAAMLKRMKDVLNKVRYVLFIAVLAAGLVACGVESGQATTTPQNEDNHTNTINTEVLAENLPTEELELGDNEEQNNTLEDVTSSESYMLTWIVEPTLEYDFIYHCCFFSTGNHSGEFIDSVTGLIIDWPQDLAFGHGPISGWVYDPEVSLFGFGGVGNYSDIMLLSIDEWTDLFPQFNEQQGLMIVQSVDSSLRNVTEIGNEYLSDDAHSGMFAVMLNGILVTDFIFNGGSVRGAGSEILYYSIPMHIEGTWGFIDTNGNVAIPFLFEHIVRIDDDSAFVRYNGRYGILNIPLTIANFLAD